MGWSFSGGGGAAATGLTSVARTVSTTDGTQTAIGAVLLLSGDATMLCNLRLVCRRDSGDDFAVFQFLGAILNFDHVGTAYSVSNGTTSSAPDTSLGTGSTLRIAIDENSNGIRTRITANAGENWSHSLVIEYLELVYS